MSIEPVPLFYGDYSNNKEPSAWFVQFQLSLPTAWTDTQCVRRFAMQLMPGQMADQWFQSLDSRHTTTFAALKTAFLKQWLPPKPPKLSCAPTYFDNSPYHLSRYTTPHCPTCHCQHHLHLIQPLRACHSRSAACPAFLTQPRMVAFGGVVDVSGRSGTGPLSHTPTHSSFVVQPRTVAFGGVANVVGRSGRSGQECQRSWRSSRSPGS